MFRCYARGRSGDHGENTHTVCRGWRVILILPGLVFYHIRPRDSGAFAGKYVEVGQQPGYLLYCTWVRRAILAKKQDILHSLGFIFQDGPTQEHPGYITYRLRTDNSRNVN